MAFVLREPIKLIKKALDDGPVQAKLVPKAGGTVRAVEWSDLLYLFAVRSLREELTPKARNEFYHALKQIPVEEAREVRFGRLSVAIGDLKAEVENRARELAELADKVEFRKDGEAVLKGSRVEIYRIAALLNGGMSPEEICEDYPSLSLDAVAVARAYAEATQSKAGLTRAPRPSVPSKTGVSRRSTRFSTRDEVPARHQCVPRDRQNRPT